MEALLAHGDPRLPLRDVAGPDDLRDPGAGGEGGGHGIGFGVQIGLEGNLDGS